MAKGIKTGGRTAGAVNKTTAEIRECFQNLVSDNLEQLNKDLNSLEPLQRLKVVIEIAKFVVPTLKATELTTEIDKSFKPIVIKLESGISLLELKEKY
jgi:ABC-type transporter Mla subunit MlaD